MKKLSSLLCVIMLSVFILPCSAFAEPVAKKPLPVNWGELMKMMDWEASSCAYSLGEGAAKVTVSRAGNDVLISGGIIENVHLVKRDLWGDYIQDYAGWHTEPGTYTFNNTAIVGDFDVWGNDDDVFYVILCDDVRGVVEYGWRLSADYDYELVEGGFRVNVSLEKNAQVTLENHTVIRGEARKVNNQNFYYAPISLSVGINGPGSSFKLHGTGSIQIPLLKSRDLFLYDSGHANIGFWAIAETDQEAVEQFVDAWQNRLIIDEKQFLTDSSSPKIMYGYGRSNHANPAEEIEFKTEKVRIRRDENSLVPHSPTLQLVSQDEQAYWLDSQMYWSDSNRALGLVNVLDEDGYVFGEGGIAWWLQESSDMYIPYPDGITYFNVDSYRFDVKYSPLSGKCIYSTEDGTLMPTVYGLKMTVDSVIPFEMTWEELPPAVTPTSVPALPPPSTGDNNHPVLWFASMTVAAVILGIIGKRRYV